LCSFNECDDKAGRKGVPKARKLNNLYRLSKFLYLCLKIFKMKKEDFTYDIERHEKFFYSQLSECGKRHYAALEAMKHGYYGVAIISLW